MPGDVLRHDTLAIALLPLIREAAIQLMAKKRQQFTKDS